MSNPPPISIAPTVRPPHVLAWLIIFLSAAAVIIVNFRQEEKVAAKPQSAGLQLDLACRYVVGAKSIFHSMMGSNSANLRSMGDQIESAAVTPMDKLRVIPVKVELQGTDVGDKDLNAFLLSNSDPELAHDAVTLRQIYDGGTDSVPAAEADRLITRHGWYARLALSNGLPDSSPARQKVLSPATRTLVTILVGGALLLIFFATGIGLLVYFGMRWKYWPAPVYGGPASGAILEGFAVYIATMAAFFLWGRLIKLGPAVDVLLVVPVALAFLWVCVRGPSWQDIRREIGLTSGRGVVMEMAAGIAGYIAGLPLIVASLLLVGILSKLVHIMPTHPIEKELQQPGMIRVFLFFLACIFAPVVEETMFRGMLLSHLRARHGWWVSAIFVSILFAAIHPQGWVGIPALATIAMILAALREKRGSLIAPMTAHALNNFLLLVFMVLVAG